MILFFHANAEDLGMSFAILKHMRDQFKVNVLAVEYPGLSPGERSTINIYTEYEERQCRYTVFHVILLVYSINEYSCLYIV